MLHRIFVHLDESRNFLIKITNDFLFCFFKFNNYRHFKSIQQNLVPVELIVFFIYICMHPHPEKMKNKSGLVDEKKKF